MDNIPTDQSLLRIAKEMQEGPVRYYGWANTCEDAAAENERLRTALRGISTCASCEACRGAALIALGETP